MSDQPAITPGTAIGTGTGLTEYLPDGTVLRERSTDFAAISFALQELGIVLSRWQAPGLDPANASDEELLNAYRWETRRLIQKHGYKFVDIVSLDRDSPNVAELHEKFNQEHVHQDDEVRFFIEGGGVFYFHVDDRVLAVECAAGDLMYFPAGIKHWFDMGKHPRFRCIRLFLEADGWIPHYTGSNIALSFPDYPGPAAT